MDYTINLNENEIKQILDALNYYSVHHLQPKTNEYKFYKEEWEKNLKLFCKFVELREGE